MHITLDTNIYRLIVRLNRNSDSVYKKIRDAILCGEIKAYMCETSFSLEALRKEDRIDKFFRVWANIVFGTINLPSPPNITRGYLEAALNLGIKILHVPRVALGSFVEIQPASWAEDFNYPIEVRQERYGKFIADFPDNGLNQLRDLGAKLVLIHKIDTSQFPICPSPLKPEDFLWLKGIVAEFDTPRKFTSKKYFIGYIRKLCAEWSDLDIIASHYAYGLDYLCTNDSRNLFRQISRENLKNRYGINIVSPDILIKKIRS